MKPSELLFGFLRVPLDFLMIFLAFTLSYKIRPRLNIPTDFSTFLTWPEYFKVIVYGSLIFIAILWLYKTYSFKITASLWHEIKQAIKAGIFWLMLIIVYYFTIRQFPFSRLVFGLSWLFAVIFLCLGRIILKVIQRQLLKYGIGKRKLLLIGNTYLSQKIYQIFQRNPSYELIGALDSNQTPIKNGPNIIGEIDQLEDLVKTNEIEEIIQTKSNLNGAESAKILDFCKLHHLQYHFVPDLLEVHRTNIDISTMGGIPLISLKPTPLDGWGKIAKRIFDIIISTLILIILSPIIAVIALLIKQDSTGPVFFTRLDDDSPAKRVGQYGRLFTCLKFRTMKTKTHNLRYTELADRNLRKGSPLVKIKNDPRVTKVGHFLRATSLDELPQLINVLKGEMSLVGPRPHLPEEVAKYQNHHRFVLEIKPGLTGLAQVSGRSDLNFEEENHLDTYYIQNWNPWLDLKILFKTFFVVFKKYQE